MTNVDNDAQLDDWEDVINMDDPFEAFLAAGALWMQKADELVRVMPEPDARRIIRHQLGAMRIRMDFMLKREGRP